MSNDEFSQGLIGGPVPQPGTVELEWQGAFSWLGGPAPSILRSADDGGIYVWSIETPQGLIPYAIGHTASMFSVAHVGHLRDFQCGAITVINLELFMQGQYRPHWEGTGNLVEREEFADTPHRLADMFEQLQVMQIHTAYVDGPARLRARIMAAMAAHWVRLPVITLNSVVGRLADERPMQAMMYQCPFPSLPTVLQI